MTRRFVPALFALLCIAGGCRKPSADDKKPTAGLHSAGAEVLRLEGKEKKPVAVGAYLRAGDRIEATGPALLEFFGGGMRFLEKGDTLEVGEADEAKLFGPNLPSRRYVDGEVRDVEPPMRIVAARYMRVEATPASTLAPREPSTFELVKAFFSPDGMDSLRTARPEGPSAPLPPPPFREKVPFIHAGPLGEGGPVAEVKDGFVVAEADDLSTMVFVEGAQVALGRTVRLVLPDGAEVVLKMPRGDALEVEGPVDLRLR
jgi:hypothetical protein